MDIEKDIWEEKVNFFPLSQFSYFGRIDHFEFSYPHTRSEGKERHMCLMESDSLLILNHLNNRKEHWLWPQSDWVKLF